MVSALLQNETHIKAFFIRQDLQDYEDIFRPFLMKGRKRHPSFGRKPGLLLITVKRASSAEGGLAFITFIRKVMKATKSMKSCKSCLKK